MSKHAVGFQVDQNPRKMDVLGAHALHAQAVVDPSPKTKAMYSYQIPTRTTTTTTNLTRTTIALSIVPVDGGHHSGHGLLTMAQEEHNGQLEQLAGEAVVTMPMLLPNDLEDRAFKGVLPVSPRLRALVMD